MTHATPLHTPLMNLPLDLISVSLACYRPANHPDDDDEVRALRELVSTFRDN